MPTDVVRNKIAAIDRCQARIRSEFFDNAETFKSSLCKQDSVVLNLQRACEAAIDLAMHMVRIRQLDIPQHSREAFIILERNGLLSPDVSRRMQRMIGFRNVAVHDYQALDMEIVAAIVQKHLDILLLFTNKFCNKSKTLNQS